MSLSSYLMGEILEIAERPTTTESRRRLRTRRPVSVAFDSAKLIREERETGTN